VHREELVVEVLVGDDLEAGNGQLGAHAEGEDAREEEDQHGVDQVEDPDLLVIGRGHPLVQTRAVAGGCGAESGRRHR
jgi:hypothetical protein